MNEKEKEILLFEEYLKEKIEKELEVQEAGTNKKTTVKDIKLVGNIEWADKINGQKLTENVFEVETEIKEIDDEGKERSVIETDYYLGDKCVGGTRGFDQVIFADTFRNSEPEKIKAIEELLERVNEKEKEEYSLNRLHRKELAEVLSAKYGREVSEEEVEKLIEEMNKEEIEELKEENESDEKEELEERKDKREDKEKEEKKLTKKQAEKITIGAVQKADLNKKVDGVETLGQRLDLTGYDSLYVVYTDKVDEVTPGAKKERTTYSLVGMTHNGDAKVLDDEFEIDSSVGSSGNREQTKIRSDNTATRDNKDSSVFKRKTNGMSIGCENNQGRIDMFLYQKTKEENENVGIQIETSNIAPMNRETQRLMSRRNGNRQIDRIQDEVKEHTDEGHEPENIKYYDGDAETGIDEHVIDIDRIIEDVFNYEVFTKDEVKEKLEREIKENIETLSLDQIIENVKNEMNLDAETFEREHKL